jgi:Tfp pilus assembly protein PilP
MKKGLSSGCNHRNILFRRFRPAAPWVAALLVLLCWTGAVLEGQTYNSQGKRDPFAPLIAKTTERVVQGPPPLEKRPPGLAGLLVSEVTVAGTAGSSQERIVILKGIDKYTYLARVGSKLFDGVLTEITNQEVVFSREVADLRGNKQVSRVVKRLYTEEQ